MDLYGSLSVVHILTGVCLGIFIQSLQITGLLLAAFSLLAVVFILFATRLNTLLRQQVLDCVTVVPLLTTHEGMILSLFCALLVLTLL
ncbi:membrane hypothetical protein [Candidatus Nitrotoga sp. HW29]|nr:membrane hypothetical protein [Candidatus Nitrotoga sp. HW29]